MPLLSALISNSLPLSVQLPPLPAVTVAFTPPISTLTAAPDSAPEPVINTLSSSLALTMPSTSIGVLIVTTDGALLSKVIVVVAAGEILPALSVCVADTVNVPLFNALISNSLPLRVQLPLLSAVTVAFTPPTSTLTAAPDSAPDPTINNALSSAALTMPSTAIGVVITNAFGATLSKVIVVVVADEIFPALSVCVADTVNVPLFRALMSNSLPLSVQLPLLSATTVAFTPLIPTVTVAPASAPDPVINTALSSAAFTIPSTAIGVVIATAFGAMLSNVIEVDAAVEILPASSVCVAETVNMPLFRALISSSLPDNVQLPLESAVVVLVTPPILTVTVAPDSAPPPWTNTSLSSAALTLPSPSIGVIKVGAFGAWLSNVIVVVAAIEILPALSA